MTKHSSLMAAAFLAAALAPSAQAAEVPSRDTGVGAHIAAQGNHALRVIRAEMTAALRAWKPALPRAVARTVGADAPAVGGPAIGLATVVACAQ